MRNEPLTHAGLRANAHRASKTRLQHWARVCHNRALDLKFWPALAQSWQDDAVWLEGMLKKEPQ